MIAVRCEPTFEAWREKARQLASADVRPSDVVWGDRLQTDLFASDVIPQGSATVRVPRAFVETAELVALHRDDRKWPLLYRILYRLTHGEPYLREIQTDEDTREFYNMRKDVTHDLHQMKAFVRFREAGDTMVAWYEPDHFIVEHLAPWFARRFGSMRWSILTPDRSAHWDTKELRFSPGVPQSAAPTGDALEELWRAYYGSVFNPARLNVDLLRQHMPERRWKTLPEALLIQELARAAGDRENTMIQRQTTSAAAFIPEGASLPVLREAVQGCRGCDLWECATQAVFGEGPADARVVFVGEQPGDKEDREGRVFIGPAGQLFNEALEQAGLRRSEVWVTNAVKHFRYEERGIRRIHKTASKAQVSACQPWVEAEIALIRPRIVVCLGATAVLSVIGRGVRLLEERGVVMAHRAAAGAMATVHPSFLLRVPDEARRAEEYTRFVDDLRTARTFAESQRTPPLPYRLEAASVEK